MLLLRRCVCSAAAGWNECRQGGALVSKRLVACGCLQDVVLSGSGPGCSCMTGPSHSGSFPPQLTASPLQAGSRGDNRGAADQGGAGG